jgi:predicted nucleic acid-binding protein
MKKLKLYLDTSIISHAIDDRDPEIKKLTLRLFEEIKAGEYEVFISELVMAEINKANETIRQKLIGQVKDIDPEGVELSGEVKALAARYVEQGIIPEKYKDDAMHIAAATVNGMDMIVSWNFEHIVKAKTIREVTAVNLLMGYRGLEIYSPLEVVKNV